ncbi:MAG: hypothetical protein IPH07_38070 [Deltaproteobacteria bacterium]|nr:hypothetical protein [Deltaproteobacteria bacterium]MBK8713636.1 hypothetical protein [Deltaproteobacteria bacterium]
MAWTPKSEPQHRLTPRVYDGDRPLHGPLRVGATYAIATPWQPEMSGAIDFVVLDDGGYDPAAGRAALLRLGVTGGEAGLRCAFTVTPDMAAAATIRLGFVSRGLGAAGFCSVPMEVQ